MNGWAILVSSGCVLGGAGALYALHRFALYLEERGHLYYLNKKPKGGGAGCFVAFQQMIEPRIQHVIHVSQETRLHADEGASGQGDPDDYDAPGADLGEASGKD
jgi:hypothetical protein